MNQQSETGKPLTYKEICDNARGLMTSCKVCRVCNGEACRGVLPGVGGKGNGDNFVRNYQKLQEVKLHLDTLCEAGPIDTGMDFLGKRVDLPFFAAPLASIENQYESSSAGDSKTKHQTCT